MTGEIKLVPYVAARRVTYEWKLEILDGPSTGSMDQDIVEVRHSEAFHDVYDWYLEVTQHDGNGCRMCLVRDVGNDVEGIIDREHAYVDPGTAVLGDSEETERCMPKRFHEEVRSCMMD